MPEGSGEVQQPAAETPQEKPQQGLFSRVRTSAQNFVSRMKQSPKGEETATEQKRTDDKALLKTRREFLKLMGKGAIAATGAATLGNISIPQVESPGLSIEEGYIENYKAKQRKFWESLKAHETPEQLSDNVVMIDFAPQKPVEGFQQDDFPQESDLIKNLLGNDAVDESQLIAEFGTDFRTNPDTLFGPVFQKHPKAAIVYDALNRYTTHGEKVGVAMQNIWKILGFKNSIHITPLQGMINIKNTEFSQDELGNQGFFIDIDPDQIAEGLKKYPDQKIVNFSFQVGRVGTYIVTKENKLNLSSWENNSPFLVKEDEQGHELYYLGAIGFQQTKDGKIIYHNEEGTEVTPLTKEQYQKQKKEREEKNMKIVTNDKPRVTTQDAYNPNTVEENIPKLIEICHAFPDKLFFAAAGNNEDDLRKVEKLLPSNLVLVGQWNNSLERPKAKVYGADIYVENTILGLPDGSSFSTPVLSAYASILLNKGLSFKEIKEKLYGACEVRTFQDEDDVTSEANVFNPQNLKL